MSNITLNHGTSQPGVRKITGVVFSSVNRDGNMFKVTESESKCKNTASSLLYDFKTCNCDLSPRGVGQNKHLALCTSKYVHNANPSKDLTKTFVDKCTNSRDLSTRGVGQNKHSALCTSRNVHDANSPNESTAATLNEEIFVDKCTNSRDLSTRGVGQNKHSALCTSRNVHDANSPNESTAATLNEEIFVDKCTNSRDLSTRGVGQNKHSALCTSRNVHDANSRKDSAATLNEEIFVDKCTNSRDLSTRGVGQNKHSALCTSRNVHDANSRKDSAATLNEEIFASGKDTKKPNGSVCGIPKQNGKGKVYGDLKSNKAGTRTGKINIPDVCGACLRIVQSIKLNNEDSAFDKQIGEQVDKLNGPRIIKKSQIEKKTENKHKIEPISKSNQDRGFSTIAQVITFIESNGLEEAREKFSVTTCSSCTGPINNWNIVENKCNSCGGFETITISALGHKAYVPCFWLCNDAIVKDMDPSLSSIEKLIDPSLPADKWFLLKMQGEKADKPGTMRTVTNELIPKVKVDKIFALVSKGKPISVGVKCKIVSGDSLMEHQFRAVSLGGLQNCTHLNCVSNSSSESIISFCRMDGVPMNVEAQYPAYLLQKQLNATRRKHHTVLEKGSKSLPTLIELEQQKTYLKDAVAYLKTMLGDFVDVSRAVDKSRNVIKNFNCLKTIRSWCSDEEKVLGDTCSLEDALVEVIENRILATKLLAYIMVFMKKISLFCHPDKTVGKPQLERSKLEIQFKLLQIAKDKLSRFLVEGSNSFEIVDDMFITRDVATDEELLKYRRSSTTVWAIIKSRSAKLAELVAARHGTSYSQAVGYNHLNSQSRDTIVLQNESTLQVLVDDAQPTSTQIVTFIEHCTTLQVFGVPLLIMEQFQHVHNLIPDQALALVNVCTQLIEFGECPILNLVRATFATLGTVPEMPIRDQAACSIEIVSDTFQLEYNMIMPVVGQSLVMTCEPKSQEIIILVDNVNNARTSTDILNDDAKATADLEKISMADVDEGIKKADLKAQRIILSQSKLRSGVNSAIKTIYEEIKFDKDAEQSRVSNRAKLLQCFGLSNDTSEVQFKANFEDLKADLKTFFWNLDKAKSAVKAGRDKIIKDRINGVAPLVHVEITAHSQYATTTNNVVSQVLIGSDVLTVPIKPVTTDIIFNHNTIVHKIIDGFNVIVCTTIDGFEYVFAHGIKVKILSQAKQRGTKDNRVNNSDRIGKLARVHEDLPIEKISKLVRDRTVEDVRPMVGLVDSNNIVISVRAGASNDKGFNKIVTHQLNKIGLDIFFIHGLETVYDVCQLRPLENKGKMRAVKKSVKVSKKSFNAELFALSKRDLDEDDEIRKNWLESYITNPPTDDQLAVQTKMINSFNRVNILFEPKQQIIQLLKNHFNMWTPVEDIVEITLDKTELFLALNSVRFGLAELLTTNGVSSILEIVCEHFYPKNVNHELVDVAGEFNNYTPLIITSNKRKRGSKKERGAARG